MSNVGLKKIKTHINRLSSRGISGEAVFEPHPC